ncbi:hypothetical protein LX36DRAFT_375399 [Colletotrichum falcatum]|nr:hypothetical protein LX36DRAFT_375399 [Colletotrichum falcatum]
MCWWDRNEDVFRLACLSVLCRRNSPSAAELEDATYERGCSPSRPPFGHGADDTARSVTADVLVCMQAPPSVTGDMRLLQTARSPRGSVPPLSRGLRPTMAGHALGGCLHSRVVPEPLLSRPVAQRHVFGLWENFKLVNVGGVRRIGYQTIEEGQWNW